MSGKVWNYAYSSENQMIQAELYEGTNKIKSIQYFYDVMGRRIKKSVHDVQNATSFERKYAYDSNEIIAELDEDNNLLARYTHSGLRTDDVLAADISSDGVNRGLASQSGSYLYLKDGLGSVQAVTTESGQLVQRYVYSSFGKLLKIVDAIGMETTSVKTSYTYTNREFDEETGLYYYRARYYDPARGQFLTEDPHPGELELPISFNSKYIYGFNNPLRFKDPSGRNPLLIAIGVGALVGGLLGGIDAIMNGKDFTSSFIQGAIVGAVIGGLYATGNGVAATTILAKSFIQASLTKGSFIENFNEFTYANTVPGSVGVGAIFVATGTVGISDGVQTFMGIFGVFLTLKDINKTACDKDYATDFARTNVCI